MIVVGNGTTWSNWEKKFLHKVWQGKNKLSLPIPKVNSIILKLKESY